MKSEDVVSLYKLLTENGIVIWLDGGWGVDALLGKQTRLHKDVDIVVEEKNVPRLRTLLENKGYKEIKFEIARQHNFVLGDGKGHEIDVHVIVFDNKGNGIYGPPENGEMYPSSSLTGNGKINGHDVKCLTAEYQVESHSGYEIKEKDIKDVTALCEKFKIPYPKNYSKNDTHSKR